LLLNAVWILTIELKHQGGNGGDEFIRDMSIHIGKPHSSTYVVTSQTWIAKRKQIRNGRGAELYLPLSETIHDNQRGRGTDSKLIWRWTSLFNAVIIPWECGGNSKQMEPRGLQQTLHTGMTIQPAGGQCEKTTMAAMVVTSMV
jgi:hypothetical protein